MANRKQGGHAAGQQEAVEGQAEVAPADHAVQPEQGKGKLPGVASMGASQVELGGQAAKDKAHSAPGSTGQESGKESPQPKEEHQEEGLAKSQGSNGPPHKQQRAAEEPS
eukprot:16123753-Heterocapsa_arctica.AAC.1